MRKENSEFKTSFISEAGSYLKNNNYFAYTELDDFACWVVVQGLDSDTEAKSAEIAAKGVLEKFIEKPSMSRGRIKKYIHNAHELLKMQSVRVRLKASMVVVVSNYSKMRWAVAGNARLYHFRNERLLFKSQDQSLAQELANQSGLSDAVDQHEERHNLLQYLGNPNGLKPFVSKKFKLQDGDAFVLCTSGFWEEIHPVEMVDVFEDAKDPKKYVDTLEEVLLSRQKRVVNPYTMAAVFVDKVFVEDNTKKKKYIKMIAVFLVVALLAGGGTIFYKVNQAKKMAEYIAEVMDHEEMGDTYFQDGNYAGALLEYSEARNAAKRAKSGIISQRLAQKLRTSQFMIDGDELVKEGDYSEALTMYTRALELGKKVINFDVDVIEQRMQNMDLIVAIGDLVKDGDFRFEAEDYEGAIKIYEKARNEALAIAFSGESDIRKKIEAAEEKILEIESELKELEGDRFEKRGDQSYARQDYSGAIDSFMLAQEIFNELGLVTKVLAVERKIMNAEEKLNPIPRDVSPPINEEPLLPNDLN